MLAECAAAAAHDSTAQPYKVSAAAAAAAGEKEDRSQ